MVVRSEHRLWLKPATCGYTERPGKSLRSVEPSQAYNRLQTKLELNNVTLPVGGGTVTFSFPLHLYILLSCFTSIELNPFRWPKTFFASLMAAIVFSPFLLYALFP